MAKALKIVSVGPVMVTILSGQLPSEMLIRAPLWKKTKTVHCIMPLLSIKRSSTDKTVTHVVPKMNEEL